MPLFKHPANPLDAELLQAAEAGSLECVELALSQGANPGATGHDGRNALQACAAAGSPECLRAVLAAEERQKQPRLPSFARRVAQKARDLFLQCTFGSQAGWREALYLASLRSPMHLAAESGSAECVRELMSRFDPKEPDPYGQTPLMAAALAGKAECVAALLPHSDPMAIDHQGCDALMRAAQGKSLECARLLLPHSDPKRADHSGVTALWVAVERCSIEVAKALAPLSDPDARDSHNRSVLDLAMEKARPELIEAIAQASPSSSLLRSLERASWGGASPAQIPGFQLLESILESRELSAELPGSSTLPLASSRRL